MSGDHQQQPRLFDELCAVLLAFLRSPHLLHSSSMSPSPRLCAARPTRFSQISPAGFSLLFLGASFALVLCGSVTFVLGCILLPWFFGFVMVLYVVGFISSLSDIGKAILCSAVSEPLPTSPKEVSCNESSLENTSMGFWFPLFSFFFHSTPLLPETIEKEKQDIAKVLSNKE